MYFVVYAIDRPGAAAIRAQHRPAHRDRLRRHEHPVAVRIGGPLLDEGGAMIGSMLVIEAENAAAVETYLAGDPYVENGLYARVEVRPFAWGLGAPDAR